MNDNIVKGFKRRGLVKRRETSDVFAKHCIVYALINCTPHQPLYGNGWGLGGVLTRVDSELSPGGAGK